jgi:aminoglycoside 3-N-acetyltransferase I
MNPEVEVHRLGTGHVALARATLTLMAEVFEEPSASLSDQYLMALLARGDFWVLAAVEHGTAIGGVTAHALPMTRSEATELFIYDLAVHPDHQRKGVGRRLVKTLCTLAAAEGITASFVQADNDDTHALEFYRAIGGTAAPVTIFTFEQVMAVIPEAAPPPPAPRATHPRPSGNPDGPRR